MKIFVYEHITGGGMLDDPHMSALAAEGDLMLRALVDDLTALPGIEVTVMRDYRLSPALPANVRVVPAGGFEDVFGQAVRDCDAVWPIAPEIDGILLGITEEVVTQGRTLLGCRADAVRIAASKRATALALAQTGIPVAAAYSSVDEVPAGGIVVKPDDGAGSQDTFFFEDRVKLKQWLRTHASPNWIFQPYIRGEARSLSLLCCEGRARLLSCNRQKIALEDGAFRFDGVTVSAMDDNDARYAALAGDIARALPGLWGYCGVDFIEADTGPIVIEINPRLTTAYAGLRRAIGGNPAQLVLDLPGSLDAAQAGSHSRAIDVEVAHAG